MVTVYPTITTSFSTAMVTVVIMVTVHYMATGNGAVVAVVNCRLLGSRGDGVCILAMVEMLFLY